MLLSYDTISCSGVLVLFFLSRFLNKLSVDVNTFLFFDVEDKRSLAADVVVLSRDFERLRILSVVSFILDVILKRDLELGVGDSGLSIDPSVFP